MKNNLLKRYIGPKEFYKKVAIIALPVAIQQFLNSSMGIISTIMVSQIGQVTAVGNAVQLEIVIITICFGAVTGAGIFVAQFFGAENPAKQKQSFGFGVIVCVGIGVIGMIIAHLFGRNILAFFVDDPVVTEMSWKYLRISLFSFIPICVHLMFSFAYRGIQKTFIPMIISSISMFVGVCINYLLIFGNFGFPELGVQGAAIGVVSAQTLAVIIHVVFAKVSKQPFMGSIKEVFKIEKKLAHSITKKTIPFTFNEFLFAMGGILYIRAFGQLGADAMESYYVGNQISNIFFFVVMGIGSACAAVLGASLGKGDMQEARRSGDYFIGMGLIVSLIAAIVILLSAEYLVMIFNLTDADIIRNSVLIVQVFALRLALRMFNVIVFASLRAGGDSKFLALLDSGIMWAIGIPLTFLLVGWFGITSIALVYLIVQVEQLIRMIVGLKRYNSDKWLQNLTR